MVFLNCSLCVCVCVVYIYLWHHLSAWNPESSEERTGCSGTGVRDFGTHHAGVGNYTWPLREQLVLLPHGLSVQLCSTSFRDRVSTKPGAPILLGWLPSEPGIHHLLLLGSGVFFSFFVF